MAEPAFLAVDPDNPQFPALYAKRLGEAIIALGGFPTPEAVQQQIETALGAITPDEVTEGLIDGRISAARGATVAGLDESGNVLDGAGRPVAGGAAFGVSTPADSITAGGQLDPLEGRVTSWATMLSDTLGELVHNPSVPGERQGDIATRYGAPLKFTVPGGVIPAGNAPFAVTLVDPTSASTHFLGSTAPSPQSFFVGTFLGVPVTVRYDKTSWTMSRVTAVEASKPASSTVPGIFRIGVRGAQSAILVSFGGRNGSNSSLISQTRRMLQLMPDPTRALLIPPLFTAASSTNDTTLAALAAEFGASFYDLRTYLVQRGLDDEGVPHTSQDDANMANNLLPPSLFLDGVHPTAAGQRAIERRIAEVLVEKGLVKASTVAIRDRVIPLPGPAVLKLPTAAAGARMAAPSSDIKNLTAGFSLRMELTLDSTGTTATIARRNEADGMRAWHAYAIGANSLRLFTYPDGTSANATQYNSDTGFGLVAGQKVSVRIDVDQATRVARFYKSTDGGASWAQVGAQKNGSGGAGTSIAVNDTPMQVGRFAGVVSNFELRSLDGATTVVSEDWDNPLGSEWELFGGASLQAGS